MCSERAAKSDVSEKMVTYFRLATTRANQAVAATPTKLFDARCEGQELKIIRKGEICVGSGGRRCEGSGKAFCSTCTG